MDQHAYRPGHTTRTASVHMTDQWLTHTDNKKPVGAFLTAKTYCRVLGCILIFIYYLPYVDKNANVVMYADDSTL